jgi:hypothetical protein
MADPDPYASIATPVKTDDDPYASVATPIADKNQDWRSRFEARIADPSNVPDTGWRGEIEKAGQSAAQHLVQPFLHPVQTLESVAEQSPPGAVYDAVTGRMPAQLQNIADTVQAYRTDPAKAFGGQLGDVAATGVMGAAGEAAAPVVSGVSRFARNFKPTPSPEIVPPAETAARNLTNAISPDLKDVPNYIKAAQKEVPNILDYAKRTNNPLNTQIEFAKAAEGSANEAADHLENNFLQPHGNVVKQVPDNFGGNYTERGENPKKFATLRDINDRVVQLNKELDKPKLNVGDERTALASKADLQAEKSGLTQLLHQSLSDLTGVAPEDIAELRQRVGRSRELANDTTAAVNKRGVSDAKPGEIPIHKTGIATKLVNAARGGETAIADRAFQNAIKQFTDASAPLPQVTGPRTPPPPAAPIAPAARMQNAQRAVQSAQQNPATANVAPAMPSPPPPAVGEVLPPARPLDRAAAQDIYERAGKDPEKARDLARKEGYQW